MDLVQTFIDVNNVHKMSPTSVIEAELKEFKYK